MEIAIQTINSLNVWETFISNNSPTALFQSWRWGEVEKKRERSIWRFGAYEGKKLVGIFQILKVIAKRGTFLHVRHGPILSKNEYWETIIRFLKNLAKLERAWFIRVSPHIEDSDVNKKFFRKLGFVPAPIHAMDGELCWVLDLSPSEEELLSNMRKTTRYEIKRAQKLGVKIEKTNNLKPFFFLYDKTSQRHRFVQHRGIQEEFDEFDSVCYVAQHDSHVLASAIIVYFDNQAIYRHGASIPSKIPASYLVQWEAIREAKKRGMKVYNFWGIAPENRPNHPWRGITLFKKGFGGREINYIHAHDLPLSTLYGLSRLIETTRRVVKGY